MNASFFRGDSLDEMSEYDRRISAHRREVRQSAVCLSIKHVVDHDRVNRIVQGHLMPVRDANLGEQKQAYLEDQGIIEKDFGVKRDSLRFIKTNVSAWTSRSQDWYNSERRIIFATTSEAQRDQWIKFFREKAVVKPINKTYL